MKQFDSVVDEILKASVVVLVCTLAVVAARSSNENTKVAETAQMSGVK